MRTNKLILLFFLLLCFKAFCKIIPADNSVLHNTRVYFEEDFKKGAVSYELFYFDSVPGGKRGIIKKLSAAIPAFSANGFEWGQKYYWYVTGFTKARVKIFTGVLHTFDVMNIVGQNYEVTRLNIKTNKKGKNAGGLVSVDYSRSLFDRSGKAVWSLPDVDMMSAQKNQIRDLKVTSDNTITFLNGLFPLELDFEGNVLWSAPYPFLINSDTISYHHVFTKTPRGTYMVMGNKKVFRKVTGNYTAERLSKEFEVRSTDSALYCKVQINLILEFSREGNLIWSWDSGPYITDTDLNYKIGSSGIPGFASHANAFSENDDGSKVYVGFRDLSRIIKIDKKTGVVDLSYGEKYPSGEARYANHLLKKQHDAWVTKRNSILVFNNNSNPGQGAGGVSSVIELKDNVKTNDSVLLWKFDLDFDTLTNGRSVTGGNIVEMPNSNLLVCAGLLNRVFEVTRKKEIVWDAFVESKKMNGTFWKPSPQYRANWTPDLAACHFIAVLNSQSKNKDHMVNLALSLYNTGDLDDSYQVEVFAGDGFSVYKSKTKVVKKNTSVTFPANFKMELAGVQELIIMIISQNSIERNIIKINLN